LPADLDWRQSSSLGLRLVQMLAGQMCGSVQTGPGPGTEFQINFNVKGITS
jgi:two-component sensor histidine kinase